MKILCLHPWGTSAEIFEKQISVVCNLLGETHNYVFLDAPFHVVLQKGPFYCWYEGLSSAQVKSAHDFILDTIEEEGPFDGVIGFSQGASLALSILYHHEVYQPHQPPPFRFAVFFCSILSISPDAQFNADIIKKYSRYFKGLDRLGRHDNDISSEEEGENVKAEVEISALDKTSKIKSAPKRRAKLLLPGQKKAVVNDMRSTIPLAAHKQWEKRDSHEDFPRVYHPLANKQRISIPTVHAIGWADPFRRQSELQARLCNKNLSRVVEFHGGHQVPRNSSDLQAVTFAIDWAIRMAHLQ
ncbi:serine hydrolase FSH [Aspergillus alliaceus]|uniref:Serine hydrolase FSH n=1 Tax=Petromyces alliaceus TaxID=209559 RepID=A0A5N7CL89_PETAA|nr:serine hydrolase FSH [Aspergillus alliaceus]